jgi:hypothetical protein
MIRTDKGATAGSAALALALTIGVVGAKNKVKVGFIGLPAACQSMAWAAAIRQTWR